MLLYKWISTVILNDSFEMVRSKVAKSPFEGGTKFVREDDAGVDDVIVKNLECVVTSLMLWEFLNFNKLNTWNTFQFRMQSCRRN